MKIWVVNLLIGGSFFLLEIIILWICYKFIYKKKNSSSKTLVVFFRMLIGYYFFVLKYRFRSSWRSHEMDDFLQEHSELRYSIFEYGVYGVATLFILPLSVVLLINCFHFALWSFIMYIAGLSVFLDYLKKSRIDLMFLLNESQIFLFKFNRKKKYNMGKEGNTDSKKSTTSEKLQIKKNTILEIILVWSMLIISGIISLLGIKDMLERGITGMFSLKNSVFVSPFYIFLLIIMLILYIAYRLINEESRNTIKQTISYRKHLKNKTEIEVSVVDENKEELNDWLDEVLGMCCLLDVKEVTLGIGNLDTKKIVSTTQDTTMPIIIIGREMFDKLKIFSPREHFEIIKLLIAHELVHIRYKDAKWMKKVYGIALLHMFVALFILYHVAMTYDAVVFGIVAFFYMIFYIIADLVCDERYWKQAMEFRADRIGMAISNTLPEILEKALDYTEEHEMDNTKKEVQGVFQKLYKNKVEQQIHPSVERRVYEAKREVPWGIREYFRYLWLIGWNVITGKGWKI